MYIESPKTSLKVHESKQKDIKLLIKEQVDKSNQQTNTTSNASLSLSQITCNTFSFFLFSQSPQAKDHLLNQKFNTSITKGIFFVRDFMCCVFLPHCSCFIPFRDFETSSANT